MRALPHRTCDLPPLIRPSVHSAVAAFRTAVVCAATALLPGLTLAQPSAADADAPSAALHYAPLPPLAKDTEPFLTDWRAAHAAVAAFPRGHADIVAWEARHGAASTREKDGHGPQAVQPPPAARDATSGAQPSHQHHTKAAP